MKLNLGCGDKLLEGYVNVDVSPGKPGRRPDVLCDLHALTPFADASVDEILAVHVIEHFWRWEVEDILREWVRVLKPGGRLVLEGADLRAACEAFLADPVGRSGPGKEGQRTMWVFYGDPGWRDPLMGHRWGYVPESLGALMTGAGLVNARREPAQFKLREPRDMRIVGDKPQVAKAVAPPVDGVQRLRIAWVANASMLDLSTPGNPDSHIASYRYRMLVPGRALEARGHEVRIIGITPGVSDPHRVVRNLGATDVMVFGKLFDGRIQRQVTEAARSRGIRTIVDVCDDRFGNDPQGREFTGAAMAAETVSTSSEALAARITEATGRPSVIVPDPVEGARCAPAWKPRSPLRVLWFGQQQNLHALERALPDLARNGISLGVTVVTRRTVEVPESLERMRAIGAPAGIVIDFVEWSRQANQSALQDCDLVLIPVEHEIPFYRAKGPNRLIEALWAGRFVVAQSLPAYRPFAQFAWVGDDLSAGLRWAIAHPQEVLDRIAHAQAVIAAKHSPRTIGLEWERLLGMRHGVNSTTR